MLIIRILIRILYCAVPVLLLVYFVPSFIAYPNLVTDSAQIERDATIVVFGTAPYLERGVPNPYFEARMDAAAELYTHSDTQHILVTGDNRTPYYNEPVAMRDALIERNVPEDAIVLDYGGRRTLDSVLRARDVFNVSSAVFISQRFHLERALTIARWHNIDAVGYIADDPEDLQMRSRLYVRELLARVRMTYDLMAGVGAEVDATFEPIATSTLQVN